MLANRVVAGMCAVLGAAGFLAGCGSDQDSIETAPASTLESPATTSAGTGTPTATSTDSNEHDTEGTTTLVETTSTTAPPETTTSAPSTTHPAQEPTATQSPPGVNRNGGFAIALDDLEGNGDIIAIELETGTVDRVLATISLEARWISRLQLNWDGTVVYYGAQTEDYWFSCASSPGRIISLDLATGVETVIGQGADPQVSPDGSQLAYLAASQCLRDFEDPANFVVTPYDSVVVRDLATGAERVWVDEELAAAFVAFTEGDVVEAQLGGLAWLGAGEIAVADRRLSVTSLQVVGTGADLRAEVGGFQQVIGFHVPSAEMMIEQDIYSDDGSRRARFLGLDPVTGTVTDYVTSQSSTAVFAFDSDYENLLQLDGDQLIVEGRTVPVPVAVDNIDW